MWAFQRLVPIAGWASWLLFIGAAVAAEPPSMTLEGLRGQIKDGRYADAEEGARRLLADTNSNAGPDGVETARVLDVLVEALWRGGKAKTKETRELAERAVRMKESALGPDDPEVAVSLTNLGSLLRNAGEFANARPHLERGLRIRERALGPDHPDVATSLVRLANLLVSTGDYRGARPLFERSLAIREKALGLEHPEVAASLNGLADDLYKLGDRKAARPLFERALAIRVKALGPDHADVAVSLGNLAALLQSSGDYEAARPLLERALEIREKTSGPSHPETATTLSSLAGVLRDLGDGAGAQRLYERALEIREKALGPQHPQVADALDNLATVLRRAGEYGKALSLALRALAIREKALRPDHPELAESLNSLANLEREMGDYASARASYERALAIREKALGPDHPEVAASLTNLAGLMVQMGEYTAARPRFERAIAIWENKSGADHPQVATALIGIASLFRITGDYASAVPLFERAIAIREKAFGPEHAETAWAVEKLALLYGSADDFARAGPLIDRAVRTLEKALGPDHPDLAAALQDRAGLLRDTGRIDEARSLYLRALEILQAKKPGGDPLDVALCMSNYAALLRKTGEFASARSYFEHALSIRERALGPDHRRVELSLNELSRLLREMGDPTGALRAALRAEEIGRKQLLVTLRSLPERQALRYAAERVPSLDVALSIAADGLDAAALRSVWDARIRSRALVLDEVARRRRVVGEAENPELARLAAALRDNRTRLAHLLVRGPGADGVEPYRRLVDSTRAGKEDAERAFAEKSSGFRLEQSAVRAGLAEITAALGRGSALVAYCRYEHWSSARSASSEKSKRQTRYLAFVVRGRREEPHVVPLGAAAEIDALVTRWSLEAVRDSEASYRAAGEALRRKIWDKLAPRLEGAHRVFVVLDGAIHLVNLGALPTGRSEYVVEGGPLLHYLSAERDVVTLEADRTAGSGLLALGGPAYDESRTSTDRETGAATVRGEASSCAAFQSIRFPPLPASALEAEEIAALFRKTPPVSNALVLTGPAASEAALKAKAPGRRVLHLATHGFFLAGQCPSALASTRGVGGLTGPVESAPPPVSGENPLVLSGLAFSGANHRAESEPGGEDGTLTGEEIAAMDLSGVEWAVLSACSTGVGEVQTGEGVLGLRRAFEVAGAGTLIMSLWPIKDEAAREWMRGLYEERLLGGKGTAEAVREASLRVLRARRAARQSTHPFHWGGFVATGDWR